VPKVSKGVCLAGLPSQAEKAQTELKSRRAYVSPTSRLTIQQNPDRLNSWRAARQFIRRPKMCLALRACEPAVAPA